MSMNLSKISESVSSGIQDVETATCTETIPPRLQKNCHATDTIYSDGYSTLLPAAIQEGISDAAALPDSPFLMIITIFSNETAENFRFIGKDP
jgi:hypothetical protein